MKKVISDTKVPIKIWTNDLEKEAEEQTRKLSELPFIYKHVAVMPDGHAGKGSTVGTVIATRGAIIPAAVGVDIGCFVYDTLIQCTDGKSYQIGKLYDNGNDIFVWSSRPDGSITPAKATPLKTRKNASLVKVLLDNDEVIICTPDHKFMLRDGTFEEVQNLSIGQSLMPFYTKYDKDGYLMIKQNNNNKYRRAHWLVADSGLLGEIPKYENQKTIIHHKNFIEDDNTVENLQFMGDSDHSRFHRLIKERNKHWQSEDFEKNRLSAIRKKTETLEGYEFYSERGTRNILNYMKNQPDHFKKSVSDNGKRGKGYLIEYNQSEKGREKSREISQRVFNCEVCNEEVVGGLGLHNHRKNVHQFNHKIKHIETLEYTEDVYCLNVPDYHNFALKAGVFVHNCGMSAVKLPFMLEQIKNLSHLRSLIEERVPTGHHENQDLTNSSTSYFNTLGELKCPYFQFESQLKKARKQLGSLGGGNHFIEICGDEFGDAWIMLHSGSRNIGKCLAEYHIDKAKGLMKQYFISTPDPDLSYLAQNTKEFDEYIHDLHWAQNYAKFNREEMLNRVIDITLKHVYGVNDELVRNNMFRVDCHHNYTQLENHFGKNVWITRKGAVSAREGEYGIIPGSMGTKSYIVKGKGNLDSFCSCSHGAGRKMSRTKARSQFTVEDLKKQTEGIECRKTESLVDEIPGAYKSIDEVMENQRDLVEVVYTLKQVICVKGD